MTDSYRVSPQSLILIPRSLKNRAYLKFITGLPCLTCGQNWWIDPAHTGPRGRGQKTTDLHTIPLCRKCHDSYHQLGRVEFERVNGLDLNKTILGLQARAVAQGIDLSRDDTPKKRVGRSGGFRRLGVA